MMISFLLLITSVSLGWEIGSIAMQYSPIVTDDNSFSMIFIDQHAAHEIMSPQHMMIIPVITRMEIFIHIVHHQMCSTKIVVVILKRSGIIDSKRQLGETCILQSKFFGKSINHV